MSAPREHDGWLLHGHPVRDYGIGSSHWPGLGKVIEEAGEVAQAAGKIISTNGNLEHWDGGPDLNIRLQDELGDLLAAVAFCIEQNAELDGDAVDERRAKKLALFRRWHHEVIRGEDR